MVITPHYYSIVSGLGESGHELVAFDQALLDAGIGDYNLVKVSSIIPPNCVFRESIDLPKGSILYVAYAKKTIKYNQLGSTAVAIAFPKNANENGVIFEASSDEQNAKSVAIEMCREAIANRGMEIQELRSSSTEILTTPGKYTCGLSAVVMW